VTTEPQIVGLMLVHNEDRFLRAAARNVLAFCDRLLIADHQSDDATPDICAELARESPKVQIHRVRNARETIGMLQPFAGTATWAFRVDGDEIYDPAGLAWTREQIVSGAWDRWWVIFGNVCNVVALDLAAGTASGHLAPPCRSMTKLYNLAALREFDRSASQPFAGRKDVFQPGRSSAERYDLFSEFSWDAARFRCLHTCFLPRSSRQTAGVVARENITESRRRSPALWMHRAFAQLAGRGLESPWKHEKYRRGPVVTVDARPFFPDRA
jgi:hypothetical protein